MAASSSAETVRVIVRCRPMNQREYDLNCQTVISMSTEINQVMLENIDQTKTPYDSPKQFTFDAVYSVDSITETIYADSVFPLVESVLEGYNATVFAYGQTGCGKSYTMQGINSPGSPQRGIIPRSFEHIFEASSVAAGTKYLIRASYLEIYNENIRDLLGKDVKAALSIKEHSDGIRIQNLTWHECTSVLDCERLMDKGNKNRATGATLMNQDSSRSHSIFTIVTEMCTRSELDGKEHIRAGKLNLVDLAGSERQSKTHAEGVRLREATRINLSLSALGNVISALVDGRSKHIPYRDSKLTRLLQDSLGGNTKTLMIAAISPAHDNYEETLSTLRYANRAKNIKNKPRINEDPRDAQIRLLMEEINRLKQERPDGVSAGLSERPVSRVDYSDEIEKEKERLRVEFEQKASEIRQQCEAERLTKEELQREYNDLRGYYDTQIEALTHQRNADGDPLSNTSRSKKSNKKSGSTKHKRDGLSGQSENDSKSLEQMDSEEKRQRLHELENRFVGGEEINNEAKKKKRNKKLKQMHEKQEQRGTLIRAIDKNDDNVMIRVFDNAQEEVHFMAKTLEQVRAENRLLKKDNEDLQYESERDRQVDYNAIRALEKELLLYRTMVKKMSSCVPGKSNYRNFERIIEQARYDEERNEYILPDPINEEVQFPQVGNRPTSANRHPGSNGFAAASSSNYEHDSLPRSHPNNSYHNPMSAEEAERRYGRSVDITTVPMNTIRNKRQEQLLNENALLQNSKMRPIQVNQSENDYMNRRLNPHDAPARLSRYSTDKQS